MDVEHLNDEQIKKFILKLKNKKIKYHLTDTGFYKNEPKIEYWNKIKIN